MKRSGACSARSGPRLLLVAVLTASGCSSWEGEFPFVSSDATLLGIKMLRPQTRATVCRTHVIGQDAPSSPVEVVLQSLRGADAEANGLLNLHIEVTGVNLGIISRTCATAVADVVRTTPVAHVPLAGGMDHGPHR